MDYQSLTNVLAVLRYVKSKGPNHTGVDLLRMLALETKAHPSDSAVARMASQIIEQIEDAEIVIGLSQLDDEAKHGVQASLNKVSNAFSLKQLNNNTQGVIGDVSAAISNLVILLSASGVKTTTQPPTEATDLAAEVEKLIAEFDNGALDPLVRETAKQHLQILATMLRHLPIFGVEAAMATYFELILKVKAADSATTEVQKKAAKPLMEKIGAFAEGLKKTNEAAKSGVGLIGHAKSAAVLFGLLPPS